MKPLYSTIILVVVLLDDPHFPSCQVLTDRQKHIQPIQTWLPFKSWLTDIDHTAKNKMTLEYSKLTNVASTLIDDMGGNILFLLLSKQRGYHSQKSSSSKSSLSLECNDFFDSADSLLNGCGPGRLPQIPPQKKQKLNERAGSWCTLAV